MKNEACDSEAVNKRKDEIKGEEQITLKNNLPFLKSTH